MYWHPDFSLHLKACRLVCSPSSWFQIVATKYCRLLLNGAFLAAGIFRRCESPLSKVFGQTVLFGQGEIMWWTDTVTAILSAIIIILKLNLYSTFDIWDAAQNTCTMYNERDTWNVSLCVPNGNVYFSEFSKWNSPTNEGIKSHWLKNPANPVS